VLRTTAIFIVILAMMVGLLFAAIKQRNRAEQQELLNRRLLYASKMNLAQQAWERADISTLLDILDSQQPQPGQEDLRSFEWYYFRQLCHSDLITLQHSSPVNSVAYSPDGKSLATGSADSAIKLWDVETGQEAATLKGHNDQVRSVA